jgi:hypothetical protein
MQDDPRAAKGGISTDNNSSTHESIISSHRTVLCLLSFQGNVCVLSLFVGLFQLAKAET